MLPLKRGGGTGGYSRCPDFTCPHNRLLVLVRDKFFLYYLSFDYAARTAAPLRTEDSFYFLFFKYSSIDLAALRPATMAVTTKSGPVTQSPPEKTPGREVVPVFLSAVIRPQS